jgi:hypothetical protein
VKYRINYHAAASSQIPGLPEEAFLTLIDTLLQVGADPWSSSISDPDEPEHRQAVFGSLGLVFYRIDDDTHTVHVYNMAQATGWTSEAPRLRRLRNRPCGPEHPQLGPLDTTACSTRGPTTPMRQPPRSPPGTF